MTSSGGFRSSSSGAEMRRPVPGTYIPRLRGFRSTTESICRAPGTTFKKVTPLAPAPHSATRLLPEIDLRSRGAPPCYRLMKALMEARNQAANPELRGRGLRSVCMDPISRPRLDRKVLVEERRPGSDQLEAGAPEESAQRLGGEIVDMLVEHVPKAGACQHSAAHSEPRNTA